MVDICRLNGLPARRSDFGLFSWILIGQTIQLILSAHHNQSESSWTDQKNASSPEGYLTYLHRSNIVNQRIFISNNHFKKSRLRLFFSIVQELSALHRWNEEMNCAFSYISCWLKLHFLHPLTVLTSIFYL